MSTTPTTCALHIHSPSTPANPGVHFFSHLRNRTTAWAVFKFLLAGCIRIQENLVFRFLLFSTLVFIVAAMSLQTCHACQAPFDSCGKALDLQTCVLPLVYVYASGNHVSTTPATCALHIHSPSTLASLGVHLFSLVKHDQMPGCFSISVGWG